MDTKLQDFKVRHAFLEEMAINMAKQLHRASK